MAATSRTGAWKSAVVVLGAAAVLLASAIPAPPPTAAGRSRSRLVAGPHPPGQVIAPGRVTTLSDPGVELTAATDGRLRGDGVALIVTGAALTDRAGQGDEVTSAGPGRHLIVFGLRQVAQSDSKDIPSPSLALVVAGDRRTIDLSALSGPGPWYFAASVPAGQNDVNLELSAAGFSQRFSLMTLTRPGSDPVVLYRDPDNPAVVTTDTSSVGVGATVVPDDGQTYQTFFSAGTVTLTWFAPDPAIHTPMSPDQAFLTVQATQTPSRNYFKEHSVYFDTAIPAARVHLLLPGGARVDAAHSGDNTSAVSGTYWFTVPADIGTATLSVDAYTGPGSEYINAGGRPATVALSAFTIPLVVNKPPVPPPTTPVTMLKLGHPAAAAPTSVAAPNSKHAANRAPLWIVLAILTAAAALTTARLRLRRRPDQAVRTTPAGPPTPDPAPPAAHAAPVTVPAGPRAPDPSPAAAQSPPTGVAAPPPAPAPVERPMTPAPSVGVADESPVISVGLLGPRQITLPSTAKLRPRELEVFVFLAVNAERTVTNDDIRAAVAGPVDDESNANTVRTWLSRVRTTVGPQVLPEADNGRYRLAGVDTDIAHFQRLTTQAATTTGPVEAARLLRDALGLVRGRPFDGLDYRWTHLIVASLETQIANAATRLAELAGELHDPGTAAWAAQRGLAATIQPDDRLLTHLLLAASAFGPAELIQAWREVTARYAAVGDAPGADLVALYDRLRTRQRTS